MVWDLPLSTRESIIVGQSDTSLRLFVGIYPPQAISEQLLAELHKLSLPSYRLTPLASVHLTLHFIGDTRSRDIETVTESVKLATGGICEFALLPQMLLSLPQNKRNPARLVAAQTDAPPPLLELHRRLVSRLAREPRRSSHDRFLPHLTLCRFRQPRRIARLDHELNIDSFPVTEIHLMRSTLKPTGAVHEAVEICPLDKKKWDH